MVYKDKVVILASGSRDLSYLSQKLHLALVNQLSSEQEMYLKYDGGVLYLCLKEKSNDICISVNFLSTRMKLRQSKISLKSEPLLRAVGCSTKKKLHVVDATAGLARDAFLLANYNCEVTLVEQSPIVAALVEDGLQRGCENLEVADVLQNMTLENANSIAYLNSITSRPDVIYLDPMFPPRSKSAKVKKEMQILHKLLGYNAVADEELLIEAALAKASGRVVVKRPKTAEFLGLQKPSHSIASKAMRYDVYVIH